MVVVVVVPNRLSEPRGTAGTAPGPSPLLAQHRAEKQSKHQRREERTLSARLGLRVRKMRYRPATTGRDRQGRERERAETHIQDSPTGGPDVDKQETTTSAGINGMCFVFC